VLGELPRTSVPGEAFGMRARRREISRSRWQAARIEIAPDTLRLVAAG
jgi:hypothetical protein